MIRAAVISFMRPGLIQEGRRAPIQARKPVAVAAAVTLAPATHCMHMNPTLEAQL